MRFLSGPPEAQRKASASGVSGALSRARSFAPPPAAASQPWAGPSGLGGGLRRRWPTSRIRRYHVIPMLLTNSAVYQNNRIISAPF